MVRSSQLTYTKIITPAICMVIMVIEFVYSKDVFASEKKYVQEKIMLKMKTESDSKLRLLYGCSDEP